MRLKGQIDLITVTEVRADIVDFKSGVEHEHHTDQVVLYGLLWLIDQVANPNRIPVGELRVSYPTNDVEVPPPADWGALQDALVARIAAADASVTEAPAAIVSEACRHCSVRHMCEDYWLAGGGDLNSDTFQDAEIHVGLRHGPLSWKAKASATGEDVLVRSSSEDLALDIGMTARILDVRADLELIDDGEGEIPVLTLVSFSEVFEVS